MTLLELKPNMPRPGYNPDGESYAFYTGYYNLSGRNRKNKEWENRDDSPDESRASLIKRIHPFINSLSPESIVLDLGAGRQIFETEYENNYGKPPCRIISMDIASIPKDRLLADGYPHIQASGRQMPFPNGKFDAVISNMAFDFMLPEALPELHRVAKIGASIFLNLHHPTLLQYNIDAELSRIARKMRYQTLSRKTNNEKIRLKRAVFLHHKHLKDNRLLFETTEQIEEYFNEGGFEVKSVEIKSDPSDKWWEVDLIKPTKTSKESLEPAATIFSRQDLPFK